MDDFVAQEGGAFFIVGVNLNHGRLVSWKSCVKVKINASISRKKWKEVSEKSLIDGQTHTHANVNHFNIGIGYD